MKKNIFSILLAVLAIGFVTSCKDEEGTTPGNDSQPVATVYQFENSENSDNNTDIRVATNNKVENVYYLAEKKADYEANLKAKGESGYKDYVVEKGTKVEGATGVSMSDFTIKDLFGEYVISVVAVGDGIKNMKNVSFTGLDWSDIATGTYTLGKTNIQQALGAASVKTTLQVCTTDETLYRFKDVFGTGHSLKFFILTDYEATDADGHYYYARVKAQKTGLTYGTYGEISVRDVGYWQGDDSWITDSGYQGYFYNESNTVYLLNQYFVSAGSLGYKGYDVFVPDAAK